MNKNEISVLLKNFRCATKSDDKAMKTISLALHGYGNSWDTFSEGIYIDYGIVAYKGFEAQLVKVANSGIAVLLSHQNLTADLCENLYWYENELALGYSHIFDVSWNNELSDKQLSESLGRFIEGEK